MLRYALISRRAPEQAVAVVHTALAIYIRALLLDATSMHVREWHLSKSKDKGGFSWSF